MEKTNCESKINKESLKVNDAVIDEDMLVVLKDLQEGRGYYLCHLLRETRDLIIRESLHLMDDKGKVLELLRGLILIQDELETLSGDKDAFAFMNRFDVSTENDETEDDAEVIAAMELADSTENGDDDDDSEMQYAGK